MDASGGVDVSAPTLANDSSTTQHHGAGTTHP